MRGRILAAIVAAGVPFLLTLAVGAVPAQAHNGHSGKTCQQGLTHVVTRSKSAGSTTHQWNVNGAIFNQPFGNVSPSNPWRSWSGPLNKFYYQNQGWGVA